MSIVEVLALYRSTCSGRSACEACRRIVTRYEKTLSMSERDRHHLETCLLKAEPTGHSR